MSLVKYSLAGLPPISQTFGGEVEIRGGGGEVGYGRMCFRWLAHVYILKQTVVPNDLYSFSENRFIHEPSCFPSPALVLLPRRKKKRKKNQDSTPRPLWSQCKIPVNYLEEKWSRGLWASV